MITSHLLPGGLPPELDELATLLRELSNDLRWSWSHAGDEFWMQLDPESWEHTRNPYVVLHNLSIPRMQQLAADDVFVAGLQKLLTSHRQYLGAPTWGDRNFAASEHGHIAYLSMEFGLGKSLPLYAGGLGILAGDHLKAASDLGVPVVGIGLLYHQGYFRQAINAEGAQREIYTYLDPSSRPVSPVYAADGRWLHVSIRLPGRKVRLRVWEARVGRVHLYLLDSNDPLNTPADRGITGQLYGSGRELRLAQEIALGIGGWGLIEALGIDVRVCHLNEGHAAFATLERCRCHMQKHGVTFWEALWATRAGNVFTTHTAVAPAFDTFAPELLAHYGGDYADSLGIERSSLLALGRRNPGDDTEPFGMAFLAARTCARANGVSRIHGAVSRRLFANLYPRWPEAEIPVGHVTNGVHVPSWDSAWSDTLWTRACGKDRWSIAPDRLCTHLESVDDSALWDMRGKQRAGLVEFARQHLQQQIAQRGFDAGVAREASKVFDPNALTLGMARRFTEYKRPNLLLRDADRFARLLTDAQRPVQIVVAGKAHPADTAGKAFIREWVQFAMRPDVRPHAVFLEDYDMAIAQELIQGVDVWVNTPRRPLEACGTSGMKVLVNGGLNLSSLDGWWDEAYHPGVGWALGDRVADSEPEQDASDADHLYRLLEEQVVAEFYDRDAAGIPRRWVNRIRASMGELAPHFSANRMVRDYVMNVYRPATSAYTRRTRANGAVARQLAHWSTLLRQYWHELRFADLTVRRIESGLDFELQVYLGEIPTGSVRIELVADATGNQEAVSLVMKERARIPGATNGFVFGLEVTTERPAGHFTPRIIAQHSEAQIPAENKHILWWDGEMLIADQQV